MNNDILSNISLRISTIESELSSTHKRLKELNICNVISFFGSARIPSQEVAQKNKALALKDNCFQIIEKTKNILDISHYYECATELANKLSLWAKDNNYPYYICTGGGPGIMEAANKGAFLANHPSLGFTITLPFETGANMYINTKYAFNFDYFFTRKFWFAYLSRAIIVFPGGFGTYDEIFEILTLLQTKKIKNSFPLVFFGTEFFKEALNLDLLKKYNLINQEDSKFFLITDNINEAFNYIVNNIQLFISNERL